MTQNAIRPRVSLVVAYKQVLTTVLENRPSGTRQRLAEALDKNRSFVSQIANAAYPIPIPSQHLQTIFDVCHFTPGERREFMDAYSRAHPHRLTVVAPSDTPAPSMRTLKLEVPDFGDPEKNQEFEDLLTALAKRIGQFGRSTE